TLTKLFAPIMPFLTESLYKNLVTWHTPEPVSVHLCDYPQVDPALQDLELSEDMEALFELVTLGSAARNTVKLKVRQPLAEIKVQPANDRQRRAAERFADQVGEELNLKKVTLHDGDNGSLLRPELKPNMKTLGKTFGPRLKAVMDAIAAADPIVVAAKVRA